LVAPALALAGGAEPLDKWAPEFQTPYGRFWTRRQIPILGFSLCIGIFWGWETLIWMGAIRLTASLHAQCFANSISHMRPDVAEGEASSQNVKWLAPVQALQGENWHGNHHERTGSARLVWTWRQIDVGW
jgi:fatty-acid desaturase